MAVEGWIEKELGDIADINWGNTNLTKSSYTESGFPAFSATGPDGLISKYEHESDGVVLSAIGARCGRCFFASGKWTAIKNTITIKNEEEKSDIKFLYHYLNREGVWPISGGAQPFIGLGNARKLKLLLPPIKEQKKIAEILESVDDAIANTESVIAQTQRVKQGLLQQLLTRGIGHTKFKQTPLGEIPESWELMLGEKIFKLGGGHGPADIDFSDDGDVLFLKVDDFNTPENSMGLKVSKLKFKKSAQDKKLNIYSKGTLVFPKRGAAIFKNRVQVLIEDAAVDPNLMCLDAFGIDALYLREYMLFIGLHNFSDNSGVPQINNKHLYPLFFPVPPKAEQRQITNALSSIDQSIQASIATISSLASKKSALMSDLLTGRVRVNLEAQSSNRIEEAA